MEKEKVEKRKSDIRKDTKKRRKGVYVKKNVEYIYVYILNELDVCGRTRRTSILKLFLPFPPIPPDPW